MTEWILSSSVLILAVILVRRLFRDRMRPLIRYALWGLVLLRLLVPISFFQSPVSTGGLFSGVQKLPPVQSVTDSLAKPNISFEDAYDQAVEDFQQAGQEIQQTIPDFTAPNYTPQTPLEQHTQEILDHSTTAFRLEQALLWVWIGGMAVMALCLLLSNLKFRRYLRIHRQLLEEHPAGLKVYICPGLDTPCLFGAVKPAVYLLPAEAEDEAKKQHILTHELTHYCHGDHIWAALRCLCLVVHWYNPLVWVAANLSRRDAELACDEATIRKLGEDQRIAYGKTLIEMTCAKQAGAGLMNTATTMTGSKSAIFERVTMIAKKPKKSIVTLIAAAVLIVTAAVICFSTQVDLPKLSDSTQSDLLHWWERARKHLTYDAPADFCDLTTKEDGLRYYGSFQSGDTEIHLIFVPCPELDIPTQLNFGDKLFTHRTGFVLYGAIYSDLYDGVVSYHPLEQLQSFELPKVNIAKALSIHKAYERQLYGSVLSKQDVGRETTEMEELKGTLFAYCGYLSEVSDAPHVRGIPYLGLHDGYLTAPYVGLVTMPAYSQIKIGNYAFNGTTSFRMIGIKDGAIYNLKELYEEGKISDTSLAQIEEKYYYILPGARDLFS